MATVKESKVPSMKVGDGTPLPMPGGMPGGSNATHQRA